VQHRSGPWQSLKVAPSPAWLLSFDQATLTCMDRFTAQGLADVLAAQVRPEEQLPKPFILCSARPVVLGTDGRP